MNKNSLLLLGPNKRASRCRGMLARGPAALTLLLAFVPPWPRAETPRGSLPPVVTQALQRARIPAASAGIFVQDTATPEPLLEWSAQTPMNPASTVKLLTTFAALDRLGPVYTWKTEIYGSGRTQGDMLEGDLIIKGYGDPKLTLERFWLLLRTIRQRGIRVIRGDLVLDHSYFAIPADDPGQFDHQPFSPYNTGPDALLLNFKSVQIRLLPTGAGAVRVVSDPNPMQLQLVNRLGATRGPCRGGPSIGVRGDASQVRVTVHGRYAAACGDGEYYTAVLGHPQYVHGVFKEIWGDLGGAIHGSVREGPVPARAELLAASESPPLAEIVRDINKFSNNVMARQLFLTFGAAARQAPATLVKSQQSMHDWLLDQGLDPRMAILENGSGLSRKERITARELGKLLLAAYRSPLMPEFVSSLPIASVDGTMRRRLRYTALAGHAHIKTGSLRGVKAIAGYVHDRVGRTIAVVCLINHRNAGAGGAAQDALLRWVYERGPQTPRSVTRQATR
ncbi:MAG: D-alanyl-D-alanine carboxypeptidase/D-alanyl-D-alanine endopeptidase [Gammaproteobacteria bacterium]